MSSTIHVVIGSREDATPGQIQLAAPARQRETAEPPPSAPPSGSVPGGAVEGYTWQ